MFEPLNVRRGPMYDPVAVQPMRDELTFVGFEELLTPEDVDRAVQETRGTLLVMINSVCGCAAGSARPAATMALQHALIPDRFVTVFAGHSSSTSRLPRADRSPRCRSRPLKGVPAPAARTDSRLPAVLRISASAIG